MQLTTFALAATMATMALALPSNNKIGTDEPFTVKAYAPNALFSGEEIQARGYHFEVQVGGSEPITYCPSEPDITCPPPTNETVIKGGALYVEVPGGQDVYIKKTGAVAYTKAHVDLEAGYLEGAPIVNDSRNWVGPNGEALVACPVEDYPNSFRIYAEVTGFDRKDCTAISAVATRYRGDSPNAWQYD